MSNNDLPVTQSPLSIYCRYAPLLFSGSTMLLFMFLGMTGDPFELSAFTLVLVIGHTVPYVFVFSRVPLYVRYPVIWGTLYLLHLLPTSNFHSFSWFGGSVLFFYLAISFFGFNIRRLPRSGRYDAEDSVSDALERRQFSLTKLFQITFFIAITFSLLRLWQFDWNRLVEEVTAKDSLIDTCLWNLWNLYPLIVVLRKRVSIMGMILGACGVIGMIYFLAEDMQGERIFAGEYFYSVSLLFFSILRAFGYRWSWRWPWSKSFVTQFDVTKE